MAELTDFNIKEFFGASGETSVQKLSIYLPDRDKNGNPVPDIEGWIQAGMILLTQMNYGVTRLPWAEGQWSDGTADASPVVENTTILYSYLRDAVRFQEKAAELRAFLRRFGKETGQGEVMFEFFAELPDNKLYFRTYVLREYD